MHGAQIKPDTLRIFSWLYKSDKLPEGLRQVLRQQRRHPEVQTNLYL
jgi:hypothetical protein